MVGFRKLKDSMSSVFSTKKSDSGSHSVSGFGHPPQPPRRSASIAGHSSSSSQLSRSSSSFSRLSRALTIGSSKKTCAICLGDLKVGQGRAIFVAECSHSFHFICISSNVSHGNYSCPICRSIWKEVPFQATTTVLRSNQNSRGRPGVSTTSPPAFLQSFVNNEPSHFSDDESLPATSPDHTSSAPHVVTIKSFTEYPAVSASKFCPEFAILAGVRAAALSQRDRAPVDLVAVLDISDSMTGSKLSLLKQAVHFVIQNLGASDRLSVVVFSTIAHRIFPLRRMTESGRANATHAINSLSTDGGTNIVNGLKKGVRVLDERRERNPVASIILLSDGRASPNPSQAMGNMNQLPASIRFNTNNGNSASQPVIPVHTFGFGTDHDPLTLHDISDASGGTFSFIESVGMVKDAFARCVGGLLSVVAQEVQLTVRTLSPGVQIGSIRSGRYSSAICDGGKRCVIDVGNLYAEEEKGFILNISIPPAAASEGNGTEGKTSLLDITCQFKNLASEELVQVEGERVEIQRLDALSPTEAMVSLEVDRQRNRILVADGIAEAQRLAERGDLDGAKAVLRRRRSVLLYSASAAAGDSLCNILDAELRETGQRMVSMAEYQHTGRAFVLSGMSSHSWQRATTRGDSVTQTFSLDGGFRDPAASGPLGYDTPSMVNMLRLSQNLNPSPV